MISKNTWRFFKADLIRKYKEQISKKVYFKNNGSLLSIALKTDNKALFNDIMISPYVQEALAELDLYGYFPLHHALFKTDNSFEKITEKGFDVMAIDGLGAPFLLTAYNHLQKNASTYMMPKYHKIYNRIKDALKNVKNVDIQTDDGETFLTTALKYNDARMCRLLLDKGASPLQGAVRIRGDKLNALEYALYQNELYTAQYLAKRANISDVEYTFALNKAERLKNLKRVIFSELQSYLIVAGMFILSGGATHLNNCFKSETSIEPTMPMVKPKKSNAEKVGSYPQKQIETDVINER